MPAVNAENPFGTDCSVFAVW
jgi:hypothetical protein